MWQFPEVLVVSSSGTVRDGLFEALRTCAVRPISAASLAESLIVLAERSICVVLCDECLHDGTYRDFVERVVGTDPEVPIIVVSPLGDWREYLKALRAGAFDYVGSPLRKTEIERVLQNALAEHLRRKFEAEQVGERPASRP